MGRIMALRKIPSNVAPISSFLFFGSMDENSVGLSCGRSPSLTSFGEGSFDPEQELSFVDAGEENQRISLRKSIDLPITGRSILA